jgi:hypothetical protein
MENQKSEAQLQAEQEAQAQAAAKEAAAKKAAFEKSNIVPILKKTKENYVPEPGTEGEIHVVVEKKSFNATSGERTSIPKLQFFSPKAYENFKANAVGLGYYVNVLHDPTGAYEPVGMQVVIDAAKAAKKAEK